MEEMNMVNEMDVNEVVETTENLVNSSDNGIGKIVIGVGLAVAAGVGALVYKNRNRIEEYRIKRLEKKGYVVTKPEQPKEIEPASEPVDETK